MMMFPSAGIFDCAIAKLPGEGSDEFLHVDIPGLQVVSGRYDPNRPIGSLSNNTVLHSGKFSRTGEVGAVKSPFHPPA